MSTSNPASIRIRNQLDADLKSAAGIESTISNPLIATRNGLTPWTRQQTREKLTDTPAGWSSYRDNLAWRMADEGRQKAAFAQMSKRWRSM